VGSFFVVLNLIPRYDVKIMSKIGKIKRQACRLSHYPLLLELTINLFAFVDGVSYMFETNDCLKICVTFGTKMST
jgi:hypothetical protein